MVSFRPSEPKTDTYFIFYMLPKCTLPVFHQQKWKILVFSFISVIIMSGLTWEYGILRIFVFQIECNTPRALIHSTFCLFLPPKSYIPIPVFRNRQCAPTHICGSTCTLRHHNTANCSLYSKASLVKNLCYPDNVIPISYSI